MTLRRAPPRPVASTSAPSYPRAVASVAVAAAALMLSGCFVDPLLHETNNQGDMVPSFEETGAWDTGDTGSMDTGLKDTGAKDTGAAKDTGPEVTTADTGPDPAGGQPLPFDDAGVPEASDPDATPDAGSSDTGLKPMTP